MHSGEKPKWPRVLHPSVLNPQRAGEEERREVQRKPAWACSEQGDGAKASLEALKVLPITLASVLSRVKCGPNLGVRVPESNIFKRG